MAIDLTMLETTPQSAEPMTVAQAVEIVQPTPITPPKPYKPERMEGPIPMVSKPLVRRYVSYPLPGMYGELGWVVTYWVNIPREVVKDLNGTDLLAAIVTHNGWMNEEGVPYPPASSEEFWTAIPGEVLRIVDELTAPAFAELPNLVSGQRGN